VFSRASRSLFELAAAFGGVAFMVLFDFVG
jgi:hypothetical protein